MEILIAIDDTDNLDSKGTGELAEEIAVTIRKRGWGNTQGVTRHQLFIHKDIPYTSHNSSMCFRAEIKPEFFEEIKQFSQEYLRKESADGSDPGLCIVTIHELKNHEKLMEFGSNAKKQIITKKEAYDLAKELGIHLSEHGGTGQGIIGALAGAGLRLRGSDGRFKGGINLPKDKTSVQVKELKNYDNLNEVMSIDGQIINDEEYVLINGKIKTVLLNHRAVLFVQPAETEDEGARWENCSKQYLRRF